MNRIMTKQVSKNCTKSNLMTVLNIHPWDGIYHHVLYFVLLSILSVVWLPQAHATDAAWVFAHRANTIHAVRAADNDRGVNAIEVDITHSSKLPLYLSLRTFENKCIEEWCAFHGGDPVAINLSDVLGEARRSNSLHAVWLDVKNIDQEPAAYTNLISIVGRELGPENGRPGLKKFWGVYGDSISEATESNYVTALVNWWTIWGPRAVSYINKYRTFIFEIENEDDALAVNNFCAEIGTGMQCGISTGLAFLGSVWSNNDGHIVRMQDQLSKTHINSLFLWNFDWYGPLEETMLRILFNEQDKQEFMSLSFDKNFGQFYNGLEGNGVIVGRASRYYDEGFCVDSRAGHTCNIARQQIENGPNRMGTRHSNIGRPRNCYSTDNNCQLERR